MADSYDLTRLDAHLFQHMANLLALRVLGAGHTSFGPGSDGGRDGFFEGEAPYPSETDRWSGTWYIQSKFHEPHLSTDPQKWLIQQISLELQKFARPNTRRVWPTNWIVVTNIDPSGTPETGSFDVARQLVHAARPGLAERFHIWGGRKVLDLLAFHPEVAKYYKQFLSPGHVLTALYDEIRDASAGIATYFGPWWSRDFPSSSSPSWNRQAQRPIIVPGYTSYLSIFHISQLRQNLLVWPYKVWQQRALSDTALINSFLTAINGSNGHANQRELESGSSKGVPGRESPRLDNIYARSKEPR
jgi:hypothetical protein